MRQPAAWRYRVLVDKHSTGVPLPGEISMLDIYRTEVWGKPGGWRYSDGPDKPDVHWMCVAEPLYSGDDQWLKDASVFDPTSEGS